MDVLTAHTPDGFLHAVTCDIPKGFGLGFERTMVAQGLTVTRYSQEDYAARRKEGSQTAPKPTSTSAIRIPKSECAWPEIGQTIVHKVIGYATVTRFVTLEGQPVALATGTKGQGLVREGQWRAATEADKPYWMRQKADVSNIGGGPAQQSLDAAQSLELVMQIVNETATWPSPSTTVDTPKASRMVGLFEIGGNA